MASIPSFLWVFIGGGLGSMCRYGIAKLMLSYDQHFPYATLLANVFSCILLGFLFGLSLKTDMNNTNKLLWMTGFCGGFSTFSTFSLETYVLFESGAFVAAFLNIALSILLCLACIFLGLKMA